MQGTASLGMSIDQGGGASEAETRLSRTRTVNAASRRTGLRWLYEIEQGASSGRIDVASHTDCPPWDFTGQDRHPWFADRSPWRKDGIRAVVLKPQQLVDMALHPLRFGEGCLEVFRKAGTGVPRAEMPAMDLDRADQDRAKYGFGVGTPHSVTSVELTYFNGPAFPGVRYQMEWVVESVTEETLQESVWLSGTIWRQESDLSAGERTHRYLSKRKLKLATMLIQIRFQKKPPRVLGAGGVPAAGAAVARKKNNKAANAMSSNMTQGLGKPAGDARSSRAGRAKL